MWTLYRRSLQSKTKFGHAGEEDPILEDWENTLKPRTPAHCVFTVRTGGVCS